MDAIETFREAIAKVFAEWEKLPRIPSDWQRRRYGPRPGPLRSPDGGPRQ